MRHTVLLVGMVDIEQSEVVPIHMGESCLGFICCLLGLSWSHKAVGDFAGILGEIKKKNNKPQIGFITTGGASPERSARGFLEEKKEKMPLESHRVRLSDRGPKPQN